jgi:hypothetical protein
MARIRRLEIRNYRSIQNIEWFPGEGVNCLIGPGDSGKSTILDAIDLCLGARRSAPISDTDFFGLNVAAPISISATLGDLSGALKNIEAYGDFLQSFDKQTFAIEHEPQHGLETVLSLTVTVEADLEPVWSLSSPDVGAVPRSLRWADRLATAPARLGNYLNSQLGWTRGSVLNRLSDDPIRLGPQLAEAARQARISFGKASSDPLKAVLDEVVKVASSLGIPIGKHAQALLDAHSVSIGDGAVALHDEAGIPLRSLGTGSARLLVAGLQRAAAQGGSGIVLVDEVETGLEPHRLQRLLVSLGAKEAVPPLQVFMTTHSPVAIRELDAKQLWRLKNDGTSHAALWAGEFEETQATARLTPEALLAKRIILCEGPSEVGLVRGLDLYWSSLNHPSLLACGSIAVTYSGGYPERGFDRGVALLALGYQTFVVVDSDKPIKQANIDAHLRAGGRHLKWAGERSTEEELFHELDDIAVSQLLSRAIDLHGRQAVQDQIRSRSNDKQHLTDIEGQVDFLGFPPDARKILGLVAHKCSWFKTQGIYEELAAEIIGPRFGQANQGFQARIRNLFEWAHGS